MADMFTKKRRSEIMGRITSKDTSPELAVRRALHRMGLRFSLHRRELPGNPDIVMPKWGIVVFVHGCFWHGHDCKRGSAKRRPKSNEEYWNPKIEGNIERDAKHAQALDDLGWKRVVVWACTAANPAQLEQQLAEVFRKPRRTR